jgi:hypothetical protein
MEKAQAIAAIDKALERIKSLKLQNPGTPQFTQFIQTTGLDLARIFGADSAVSRNFNAIDYQSVGSFMANPLSYDQEIARRRMGAYLRGLGQAEGILLSAREQLEEYGVDRILQGSRVRSEGAKVFVSHGRESAALTKVERFLRALGCQPVIVVRGPSEGMSVDDLVELRMQDSDCAIILATADDDLGDRRQPRPNVIHEIGMAQEKLENKVIYLKEVGCDFPSNVGPKVWENFTQNNMEAAFEKISKELHAFHLL